MRIAALDVIALSAKIDRPVDSSIGRITARNALLVRLVDESGEVGLGEVWINFPPWGLAERRITLEAGIRPLITGQSFDSPLDVWPRFRESLERLGRQCGNTGLLYQAISGVEIALWDLHGKQRRQPVYVLLREVLGRLERGQQPTQSPANAPLGSAPAAPSNAPLTSTPQPPDPLDVPVYASGLGPPEAERLAERHLALGVQAFKLKLGFGSERDRQSIERMRRAIDDADLMVDVNQGWSVPETRTWFAALAEARVRWLEEPIPCDDYDGLARLRAESPVPIAVGENQYTPGGWRRLVAANAVHIVQPDVCKCGGLSEALTVALEARRRGLAVVPHYLGGAVGLVATMHLLMALASDAPLEYDANPNPLREQLCDPAPVLRDGRLRLPAGPGLGVSLDDATLTRLRV